MADFSALKTAIQTYIKQNGNEEITGDILQEILLSVVTTLGDSAINDLVTALANEVAARQNADGTLQQNITNEATARGNADTALGGRIDDEATARSNADTALSDRLGSTITAENTAADQIGAEAEARAAADTALQGLIDGITDNIENGYVYAGIATPSSTPATGKVFYLALTAGTYTNFGNTEVSQGINILKYNGSAWSLDAFIGIDDELTPSSNNLPKSGNVLENIIKNGSAFDLSAYNAVGGVLATYADLDAALTALNALPAVYKQGGMSFRFVRTSDNKYVQYRLMSDSFNTTEANWQGVDDEPTAGSDNLVKSGGVVAAINDEKRRFGNFNLDIPTTAGTSINRRVTYNIPFKSGDEIGLMFENLSGSLSSIAVYFYKNDELDYLPGSPLLVEEGKPYFYNISDNVTKIGVYCAGENITASGKVRIIFLEKEYCSLVKSDIKNNLGEFTVGKIQKSFSLTQNTAHPYANEFLNLIMPKGAILNFSISSGESIIGDNRLALRIYHDLVYSDYTQFSIGADDRLEKVLTKDVYALALYATAAQIGSTGTLTIDITDKRSDDIKKAMQDEEDTSERVDALENQISSTVSSSVSSLAIKKVIKDEWPYYEDVNPETLANFDGSYIDAQIRKVPKGKHFIFVTDTHFGGYTIDGNRTYTSVSAKNSNFLINYVKQRLGIQNVVFGGDCLDQAPDKYLGAKLLSDYADEFYSAFGKYGIWVQGNHDTNMTPASVGYEDNIDHYAIPDTEVYKRTVKNIEDKVVFDEEGIANLSSLNLPSDELAEATAWFKMHYYYDNPNNKIRYIVLETCDNGFTCTNIFGIDDGQGGKTTPSSRIINLQRDFVYRAMKSCPVGYTIVITGHMVTASNLGHILNLFYSYRNKTSVKIWWQSTAVSQCPGMVTYFNSLYGGSTNVTYDFSDINTPNNVLIIGGHWHSDFTYLFDISSVNQYGVITGEQVLWDGVTVPSKGEALVATRNRDVFGSRAPSTSPYYATSPEMTEGTVTESCFDVVTIKDDGSVEFTRFGPTDLYSSMNLLPNS